MNYEDEDRLELILELIDRMQRRLSGVSKADFLADRDSIDLTA